MHRIPRIFTHPESDDFTGVYLIHHDPIGDTDDPFHTERRHYIGSSRASLRDRVLIQLAGKSKASHQMQLVAHLGLDRQLARVFPTTVEEALHVEYTLKDRKMGGRYCPICNPLAGAITVDGAPLPELDDESIRALVEIPF